MDEFLHLFPNAVTDFYDETKSVTDSYREHAVVYLKNAFPVMHAAHIERIFKAHHSHLTPALRQLEKEMEEYAVQTLQSQRGSNDKNFSDSSIFCNNRDRFRMSQIG